MQEVSQGEKKNYRVELLNLAENIVNSFLSSVDNAEKVCKNWCVLWIKSFDNNSSKVSFKMADVSALGHIVEKTVFQSSINYDDTIRNCNFLDIINVSGKLEVILGRNERMLQIETHQRLISIWSAWKMKQTKMIHKSLKVQVVTSL